MTESSEQIALLKWASTYQHNGTKIGRFIFAIPNEAKRSQAHGARMKAQGLRSGVPDLMFAYPHAGQPGLFIEMKSPKPKGKVTDNQKKWLERLQGAGYVTAVCWGMEEAKQVILDYLGQEKYTTPEGVF